MTPEQYREHLHRLGFTQQYAGVYFGTSKRTGARWAADGPPLAVAMLLVAANGDRMTLDVYHTMATQRRANRKRK